MARLRSICSVVGTKVRGGIVNNECIVTPPALIAAIPVGATTMCFLRVFFTKLFRKVVLPVPALPVKKTLLFVCSSNSTSASNE